MKKKIFLYIFVIVFFTSISITFVRNFYTEKAFEELFDNYEKFALKKLEDRIILFYKLTYIIESEVKRLSKNALLYMGNYFKDKDINEISDEDLIRIKKKFKIIDIYIINREGVIVKTTDKVDLGLNIFSISSEFKENLLPIYGSGKMFFERLDPSANTGKFNLYSYYGLKGKDYLIETGVTFKDYIINRYSKAYYDYLMNDFFKFKDKELNYIVSLDIYHRAARKTWSIVHKGKYTDKPDSFFNKLQNGKVVRIKKGSRIEIWEKITVNDEDFNWGAGKYINVIFDFSPIYKYKRKIMISSFIIFVMAFVFFYIISLFIFDKFFLKRLFIINKRIKEIARGDYKSKIRIEGKDEFWQIAKSINKMAADIDRVMTQLKNQTKILEKKVKERTKELKFKNDSLTKLSKKLDYMARTDYLTGLTNRRGMLRKIKEEKTRYKRSKKPFSLILLDIDDFKKINDKYGHDQGDLVLKKLAETLKNRVREQDTVCRWGGEEFLIFLPETTIEGAKILANKLRKKVEELEIKLLNKKSIHITITLGISVFDDPDKDIENILKEIDLALYKGKKEGKNRTIVFQKQKD